LPPTCIYFAPLGLGNTWLFFKLPILRPCGAKEYVDVLELPILRPSGAWEYMAVFLSYPYYAPLGLGNTWLFFKLPILRPCGAKEYVDVLELPILRPSGAWEYMAVFLSYPYYAPLGLSISGIFCPTGYHFPQPQCMILIVSVRFLLHCVYYF
jgi:hypothetical protein